MVMNTLQRIERKLDNIKQSEGRTIIISVATATLVSLLASDSGNLTLRLLVKAFGENPITKLIDLGINVLFLSAMSYGIILLIVHIGKKLFPPK